MSKPVDRMVQWPESRSGHAAASYSVSGPVMAVIGGGNFTTLNECWITTATTKLWKKVRFDFIDHCIQYTLVCGATKGIR